VAEGREFRCDLPQAALLRGLRLEQRQALSCGGDLAPGIGLPPTSKCQNSTLSGNSIDLLPSMSYKAHKI